MSGIGMSGIGMSCVGVAITGSRDLGGRTTDDVHALFDRFLAPFDTPETHWFLGGAAGIDTLALSWLTKGSLTEGSLTEGSPTRARLGLAPRRITVAVPVRVHDQPVDAQREILTARDAGLLHELVELDHPAGTHQPGIHEAGIHQAAGIDPPAGIDQPAGIDRPAGIEQAWEARNQWLVDHSAIVIGFPSDGTPDGSGTWQTLTYAAARGRARLIVPPTWNPDQSTN